MIVRVSANYEKMLAKDSCGEAADYYFDVIVFSGEGKPLFSARACSVYVDGIPLHPGNVYLAEAIEVVVKGREVFIDTPLLHKVKTE
jgi:hypothetical protein